MPIQVTCPACRRSLRVPDDLIGQLVKCPNCLTEFSASVETQTPSLDPAYRAVEHAPPPVRLPPPPERDEDDDWDDDFDLLRRGVDREAARNEVFYPAIALITTGIVGLLLGVLFIGFGLLAFEEARGPDDEANAIGMLVQAPFSVGLGIVVLLGGIWMMKLKRHGLAIAASVIALMPCVSPCCVIGLPAGIWAMVVLTKTDVKRAFS